jgi:hypothetical protein
MGVLFAAFRGEIFRAEFGALRSFARRRPAGVAGADLFWHGGASASCLRLPISDLNAVIRRAGAVAVEQLFGETFQRATQKEDERG